MSEKSFEIVSPQDTQEKPKYTLADLEEVLRREENYVGPNNPGAQKRKYKEFGSRIKEITDYLVDAGVLRNETAPVSEHELVQKELDTLYPNAKSKKIVTHKDKRYQIQYYPSNSSISGKTIYEWGHRWDEVKDKKEG